MMRSPGTLPSGSQPDAHERVMPRPLVRLAGAVRGVLAVAGLLLGAAWGVVSAWLGLPPGAPFRRTRRVIAEAYHDGAHGITRAEVVDDDVIGDVR